MTLFDNPTAFQYLMYGIASARSIDELKRMQRCVHAHYSGVQLRELEAEIELRSRSLPVPTPTPIPIPVPVSRHHEERAVGD